MEKQKCDHSYSSNRNFATLPLHSSLNEKGEKEGKVDRGSTVEGTGLVLGSAVKYSWCAGTDHTHTSRPIPHSADHTPLSFQENSKLGKSVQWDKTIIILRFASQALSPGVSTFPGREGL